MESYRRTRRLLSGRLDTVVELTVLEPRFYMATPWVDQHLATRQENAPEREIHDYHVVVEYRDGTCVGR